MGHCGWLIDSLYPERLELVSNYLAEEINKDKENLEVNSIAVIGLSGYIMGALVSVKTNLPLILCRKNSEDKHSCFNLEFGDELKYLNYIIVDDLISSGDTIRKIKETLFLNEFKITSTLKKIYLYRDSDVDSVYEREFKVPISNFYSDSELIERSK